MPAKASAPAAKAPPKAPADKPAAPAKEKVAAPAKEKAAAPAKEKPAAPAKEKPAAPAKEKAAAPAKEKPAAPAKEKPAAPAKEKAAAPAKEKPAAPAKEKAAPAKEKPAAPAKAAPAKAQPKAAAPAKKESKATSGIYVKNWGRSGVAAAKALFEGYGKIVRIALRRGKYCQVWYENANSAKQAADAVTKDKRGHPITIVSAKAPLKPNPRDNTKVVCATPIFRENTTRKQLLEYFGTAGKVVKLRTYANNTAYVYFDTAAAAAKAIAEKNGKSFKSSTLIVTPSVRSVEADKKKEEKRKTLIDLYRWMKAQKAVAA